MCLSVYSCIDWVTPSVQLGNSTTKTVTVKYLLLDLSLTLTLSLLPWYNCNGWLCIQHQVTFSPPPPAPLCLSPYLSIHCHFDGMCWSVYSCIYWATPCVQLGNSTTKTVTVNYLLLDLSLTLSLCVSHSLYRPDITVMVDRAYNTKLLSVSLHPPPHPSSYPLSLSLSLYHPDIIVMVNCA